MVNEMRFLLVLERLGSIFKRCRPAFAEAPARRTRLRQAGLRAGRPKSFPPAPLDLAFPWISITGKEMLTYLCDLLTTHHWVSYETLIPIEKV